MFLEMETVIEVHKYIIEIYIFLKIDLFSSCLFMFSQSILIQAQNRGKKETGMVGGGGL